VTGPEVLALWRRFAWTERGSPRPGFTLTAEMIWEAPQNLADLTAR
jgi:CelD/BcsL family acetyltransferase involved in cellulose biosynthesis